MEGGKGVEEKKGTNDYVVQILDTEEEHISFKNESRGSNLELTERHSLIPMSTVAASASPEIRRPSPTSSRLPRMAYPREVNLTGESTQLNSTSITPTDTLRSAPITPKTPLIETPGGEDDPDETESKKSCNKLKMWVLIEGVSFVCILGFLIASFTVNKLEDRIFWGLELWKWCVMVLVVLCGRLVTKWFINIVLGFLVRMKFLPTYKFLYLVHGLRGSVQVFIWFGFNFLAWALLFDHGVKRSRKTSRILHYITRAMATFLIGAAIWLVKNGFVKLLASSYQCTRFFDRIQEVIFHQCVLHVLSQRPPETDQLSLRNLKKYKNKWKEEVNYVEKSEKINQEKNSRTKEELINSVMGSWFSFFSQKLDSIYDEKKITRELDVSAVANHIFKNVAKSKDRVYIEEDDLKCFLVKEEVDLVLPLLEEAAASRKININSLRNWLVKVYHERKLLVFTLNDDQTAIEELNRIASGISLPVILIVWLLLMGFLTTKTLVFISSQLLLAAFVFGSTAKTVFEAIMFVFVMHPFDVGDRCVVDGVQMIVEEMNILTTIFLRYDNELICYPNSVLACKPISNYFRSPEEMGDSVEFAVDFSTSIETVEELEARIKMYLESKPDHWKPEHSVVVKDIEDVNKMKMALYLKHTINFQNYGDRNSRRSELVLELKKIFEKLGIKYNLLPQKFQLSNDESPASEHPPTSR